MPPSVSDLPTQDLVHFHDNLGMALDLDQNSPPMFMDSDGAAPQVDQVHRLFRIEEVLNEVFHFLSPPVHSPSDAVHDAETGLKAPVDKVTLLSAALSCRAFCEPALDALWRTLDSLDPLCALLPFIGEGLDRKVGDLISSNTSSVLNRYQNRVQTLIWTMRKDAYSSQYFMLTAFGAPFLPHLQALIIPNLGLELEINLLHTLGSSLIKTIDITYTSDPTTVGFLESAEFHALISTLCYRSRNSLQQITFPSFTLPLTVISLPFLKSIHLVGEITNSTLRGLSTHPNLKRVEFLLSDVLILPDGSFRSLEEAHLTGWLSSIKAFLNKCASANLRSLSLDFASSRQSRPMRPILHSIIDVILQKWGATLSSFTLTDIPRSRRLDIARYLERLHSLPIIYLQISFSDDTCTLPELTLTTIASYFPYIRYLHLPPFPADSAPTISELCQVATLCPSLWEISVSLNTQPTATDVPILKHGLGTLFIHASPVSDVWYTAQQLYRAFPHLKRVSLRSGVQDKEKWAEVEKALGFARWARRLEHS